MKVVIVDDEQHSSNRIISLLEPFKNISQIEVFDTVTSAVNGINTILPDVVFLDIHIHDKTGFDILEQVDFLNFSLIFTTAFEKYAIEAFKFSAIDYLLKPVEKQAFDEALNKALEKNEKKHFNEKLEVMFSHLSTQKLPKKISLAGTSGYVFVEIDTIIRCESSGNYTWVFTTNQKKIIVTKTLKYFEQILAQQQFFRIHNSHLINMHYVKSYAKSGFVTLEDNSKFEVSVRRKEAFLKACRTFFTMS